MKPKAVPEQSSAGRLFESKAERASAEADDFVKSVTPKLNGIAPVRCTALEASWFQKQI